MADGYLKIKTKIDNSNIDKDIKVLENKIKKIQSDNMQANKEQENLQKEIEQYEELHRKAESYKHKLKELKAEKDSMQKANPSLLVQVDTPELASVNSQMESIQQKYIQTTNEIDKQAPKIEKVHAKLEKVKNKQTENNAKITEFQHKIDQIQVNKVEKGIDSVGNSIQKTIGKLGKMTLAIFGIRTAFNAVRSVISTLSQYNPQLAADIEYIKYAVANTLLPIIQKLVSLAYTLLTYLNAIMSAWFGINLFSNSSAKAFQDMKNNAAGTAKSAKEIQKSLQGFDEMNVLQDNSSDSSGSGAGIVAPSMDLSGMQGEVPAWLQWIINNKDTIISTLTGIAAGVLAIKLGVTGLKALGIGLLISGIIGLVQSLIGYLNDGSWKNFGKIITYIGVALLGLALIIGSVPLAIGAAIAIIVGLIVSNWEKIKGFFTNAIEWMKSKTDWVKEHFGLVGQYIWEKIIDIITKTRDSLDSIFNFAKSIFDRNFKNI